MPEFQRPCEIARRFHTPFWGWITLVCTFLTAPLLGQTARDSTPRANFDALLRQLPPLQRHDPTESARSRASAEAYEAFLKEKLSGRWFAAVVPDSPAGSYEILRRF